VGDGRRVAVVGGGISGLATSYFLTRPPAGHRTDPEAAARRVVGGAEPARQAEGADGSEAVGGAAETGDRGGTGQAGRPAPGGVPQVILLESGPRLGGKIVTADLAGFAVDAGPDAILVRRAVVEKLLRDLGLLDRLSRPALRRAYVWTRGELRPLPPTSLFGVPDTPLPLLRSRVLSPWGALRAGADFVLPRQDLPPDPTIAQLLRPRFGREVFDRLVEPMLGGLHAGRADVLSARSTVPEVYVAARAHRSTYLALRRCEGPQSRGLGMVTVQGGLVRLVDALRAELAGAGARVRTGARVTAIERVGAGYRLLLADGDPVDADAVVLATPAFVSGPLLAPLNRQAAAALAGIPYVGIATVSLAYRRAAVGRPLDGTGFLVPPREGRFLVGCTWSSAKWPHLADDELTLFRCSVGRHGDLRWTDLDDGELVDRVHNELVESVGVSQRPVAVDLQRWPVAMPQYTVGHEHRLVNIATALRGLPGLYVTGAAYRGVGIASCISQAADVAAALVAGLDSDTTTPPAGRSSDVSRAHR
jgi:oxygen-dependent protoporphyrinogen oxidase